MVSSPNGNARLIRAVGNARTYDNTSYIEGKTIQQRMAEANKVGGNWCELIYEEGDNLETAAEA